MSDSYRRTRLIPVTGINLKPAGKRTIYQKSNGGYTADVFTGFMNVSNDTTVVVTISGTNIRDQTGAVAAITMIPAIGRLYPIMCSGLTASVGPNKIIGFLD